MVLQVPPNAILLSVYKYQIYIYFFSNDFIIIFSKYVFQHNVGLIITVIRF